MKFIARIGLALVTAGASEGFIIGRQIANNIIGNIEEKEDKEIDNLIERINEETEIDFRV